MRNMLSAIVFASVLAFGFTATASAGQYGVRAYCQTPVGYGPLQIVPVYYLYRSCTIFIPGVGRSVGQWLPW